MTTTSSINESKNFQITDDWCQLLDDMHFNVGKESMETSLNAFYLGNKNICEFVRDPMFVDNSRKDKVKENVSKIVTKYKTIRENKVRNKEKFLKITRKKHFIKESIHAKCQNKTIKANFIRISKPNNNYYQNNHFNKNYNGNDNNYHRSSYSDKSHYSNANCQNRTNNNYKYRRTHPSNINYNHRTQCYQNKSYKENYHVYNNFTQFPNHKVINRNVRNNANRNYNYNGHNEYSQQYGDNCNYNYNNRVRNVIKPCYRKRNCPNQNYSRYNNNYVDYNTQD